MAVKFVQGAQKTLTFRFRDSDDDPVDLTNYDVLNFCMPNADGLTDTHKKRIVLTGDIAITSPIIMNIDTTELMIGDLIAGTGITPGSLVLTVDSVTQLTMDQAALATTVALPIIAGDAVFNGNPLLGKVNLVILPADGAVLPVGTAVSVECKTKLVGIVDYVEFPNAFIQSAKIC